MGHSLELSQPVASFEEFLFLTEMQAADDALRRAQERALFESENPFLVTGFCAVCDRAQAEFLVDFTYSWDRHDGVRLPNWREHLTCRSCGLNNRLRAAFECIRATCTQDKRVYLTERMTPLYEAVARAFPGATGSEYLRDRTPLGETNRAGIRNEDVTRLRFQDQSLDYVASFDVLEHVPDYEAALREFYRVLRDDGYALITVPFFFNERRSKRRAIVLDDGGIEHLESPEYHGDPLDASGVLCFHNFGWEFLDALRAVGFEHVAMTLYWSRRKGYLGQNQFLITAQRPRRAGYRVSARLRA